jgi:hypothetical protein
MICGWCGDGASRQVRAVKENIERETRDEFASIAERLRASESVMLIQLQAQHDDLARQVPPSTLTQDTHAALYFVF